MKGKIIILEGLERTGKSSIASELEKLGYIVFKDRNRTNETWESNMVAGHFDVLLTMLQKLSESGVNIALDRFYLTEMVYGKRFRGSVASNCKYIDNAMAQLNAILVLTYTTETYEQYSKRALIKYNKEFFTESQENFNLLFEKSEIKKKVKVNLSVENAEHIAKMVDWMASNKTYDFYLASPFFNEQQIEREEYVKKVLRNFGYSVYSPRENGILTPDATDEVRTKVFNDNCEAIHKSDKVLAITDGKDIGTIWEAGYAYGIGKKVVYYAETLGDNPFNVMLGKSGIGVALSRCELMDMCRKNDFENNNAQEGNVQ